MPYYHDPKKKMVAYVPDEPLVHEIKTKPNKRNKIPRREAWSVQAEIEITRGNNFIIPRTNQWHYKTSEYKRDEYPPTDLREEVVSWFKMNHLPKMGEEISKKEYLELKKLYETKARKNKPPE